MTDNDESLPLEEHLDEDDWALIIGNNGKLKGMFIPNGKNEDEVPKTVLVIMKSVFGMDLNEDDNDEPTIH